MRFELNRLERPLQWGLAAIDWARDTVWKRLVVWVAVLSLFLGSLIVGWEWLIWRQDVEGKRFSLELELVSRQAGLEFARDRIADCVEAEDKRLAAHEWYCARAAHEYLQAFKDYPQENMNEVIRQHAYLAMRSDVAHLLRLVEPERLTRSRGWAREEHVRLALSWKAVGLWAALVIFALGFIGARWRMPRRARHTICAPQVADISQWAYSTCVPFTLRPRYGF